MPRRKENWKESQEQTFTKWLNNILRGHKKSAEVQITSLQADLKDGLILVQLLESLTKEKMPGVHRKPHFEQHKIDNLNACFKFMEKANIKLVNIGNMDIYNGNMKLILGLIWTLVRRFQIRSMGTALSTKEALLAWVNTQIPDQNIKNFTTDWNNGIALCALVDRIKPGACPQYATLKSSEGLENCTQGITLAEDELGILRLMEPDDLCHPEIDELSVMTYISSFCKPANDRLLAWIQSIIPDRSITNFNKDWNNGINLSCLLDALLPGTLPDCQQLDPHQSLDNLVQAMKIGEEHLGVKPVLTPAQLADPKVDDLNVVTYLSRFQYAKPIPQPHLITCKGHGLFKAIVGRPATFDADCSKGGIGELSVVVTDSKQNPIDVEIIQKEKGQVEVKYTAHSSGKLTVEVKWSDSAIPGSPFHPEAIDLGAFSFTGKQITGGQSTKIGSLVVMEAKGITEVSDLYVLIQHSDGHTETAKSVLKDDGEIECTYTPTRLGKDEVFAKVAGTEIPGSPFEVKVVDPSQCSVQMKDPPSGQPLTANKPASFTIMASAANLGGIVAEVVRPGSSKADELNVIPQGDGSNVAKFTPVEVGEYKVAVTCAEEDIRGSPLHLVASDPHKCEFLDPFPSYVQLGKPCSIRLSVKGAGTGAVDVSSSQSSVVAITSLKSNEPELYKIELTPNSVGEADIDVKWEGNSIAPTPHSLHVCDATKCSAYGPGLTAGRGKCAKPFDFTVQTKGGGKGELFVKPRGQKAIYAAEISKSSNGTYNVTFTTYEVGVHMIDVLWGDINIPDSPFKVDFVKVGDATQFTASGDGLKEAIALSPAKILLVGPTSGLLEDNVLRVQVSNDQIKSTTVSGEKFDPKCGNAVVCVSDNDNASYSVEYAVPTAGVYSLSITSDGSHIPGSPFKVNALAASDASKCRAFGEVIDNPNCSVMNKSLEFKVDVTSAGSGHITATATDSSSSSIPVFTAEDKSNKSGKVYTLKIDPKQKGVHRVRVVWSGVDIPGSPFSFNVGNPKDVVIHGLPDSATYVARIKEPISFSVDASKAGKGELKCAAKLDGDKMEDFQFKTEKGGKVSFTYTPQNIGRMELVLTYSGENVLPSPWMCEITNPSSFQVIPPKEHVRQHEYAKFIISGLTEKNKNKLKISAIHPEHLKPTIKDEGVHGSAAVYRFTAKKLGEYEVEVKIGSKHIAGSPFWVQVANPENCKVNGAIPTTVPLQKTEQLLVDTSAAGSGEISFKIDGDDCLDCKLLVDPSDPDVQIVKMTGLKCGQCSFRLQWAGFDIPKMPVDVAVVDPTKCSYRCDLIKSGLVKTSDKIPFIVNTYKGGNCAPVVVASGPKAKYSVYVEKTNEGEYTASFTPWQDGRQTVQVSVGGVPLNDTPVTFEAFKPLDHSKITVTGEGVKQAIANQYNKVTLMAGESKLFQSGLLAVNFQWSESNRVDEVVEMEITDQQNGSYSISYKPLKVGKLKMKVTGEGKDITGSPFNIEVLPEPDASMCRVTSADGEKSYFVEGSTMYHQINTPVVLSVDVSGAGTGTLKASGRDPNNKIVRVLAAEEQDETHGKRLYMLRFDPTMVGSYTLNLMWDSKTLPNCPYKIHVVDPKKCKLDAPLPVFLQVDQTVSVNVCTSEAGAADLDIVAEDESVKAQVERKDDDNFTVTLTGVQLGKTRVLMKYGGFSLTDLPHTVSVCDPRKCGFGDLGKLEVQVGVPFTLTVKTDNAGKADLQIKPVDTEKKYTFDVREESLDEWKATCTAWTLGEHELKILWGEWELPGSPIKFSAVDPKKIKITDIPDPQSYVAIIGEPISFTVDYSEAGDGTLNCSAIHGNGEREEMVQEQADGEPGMVHLSIAPKVSGKMELILKFNGVDLISPNLSYDIPDPSMFQVIPPKGFGKFKDSIKFAVTGLTVDTELSFKATHPEGEAAVEADKGKDGNNVIAQFAAKHVGDYEVEVKLKDQHITGSPFTVRVTNPEGCVIVGDLPTVVHSGDQGKFEIDTSSAGPGELGVQTEVISGDIEPTISQTEDGKWSVTSSAGVGQCQLTAKWADYVIPKTPFVIQFVDSGNVVSSCEGVVNDTVKQGELVTIQLDASRAGLSTPEVKAVGPKSTFAVQTTNNNNGTFTLTLNPYQVGENTVTILWGGKDVPSSPIKFMVSKVIEARTIIASGEGIKATTAKNPTTVKINAPDSGLVDEKEPLLTASLVPAGSVEDLVNVDFKDTGCGSYDLIYTTPKEGDYELEVLFEKQHIHGSPFKVHAFPSPKAEKCKVFGKDVEKKPYVFQVSKSIQFGVDITEAGKGDLTMTGRDPSGKLISTIFTNDQERDGRKEKHARYTPEDIGHHILEIKWEGIDIPGSPLDMNVVDPSRCKVKDLPKNGIVEMKPTNFSVNFEGAGDGVPEVTVGVSGSSSVTPLDPTSRSASEFSFAYTPESFGNTVMSVRFGGYQISNSPYNFTVADPNRYSISRLNLKGKYARVSESVVFDISSKKFTSDDVLEITMHGPRGEKDQQSLTPHNGKCSHSFVPLSAGSYDIFVECSSVQVNGSPLQINVVDPLKCEVFGKFPCQFQVGAEEEVIVNTQSAGDGELQVLFNGEKEHPSFDCGVERQDIYSHVMKFKGKQVDAVSINVMWGGFNIKGSPFSVNISDASKCKVYGQVLTTLSATTGEPVTFSVETKEAGKGELNVTPKGPSATYKPDINVSNGKYDVSFTPWEVGKLSVDVSWGKSPVPNSPFIIKVENSKNICNATGDGLKTAVVGQEASFTIITTEMGLLEKKAMAVSISGVRAGRLKSNIKDNENGTYTVTYTPQKPGAYVANIAVNKTKILGSPFKINVVSAPDATKCIVGGPALQPNSLHLSGSHLEVTVDSSEAGTGKLDAMIEGPNKYRPRVYMSEGINGLYSIKFQATNPGRYMIQLLWSGQEIPGSPFKVRVYQAPDASKVKAYGSGLEDGYVRTPGEFIVDTRNAGIGTVTINVHGIKDSFRISAKRSEGDSRILTGRYDPKKKGEYVIRMLWDGVHIPRSPFVVRIRGKPGSHVLEEEEPKRARRSATVTDKAPPLNRKAPPTQSPEQDSKVLESTFAKAAPVYDVTQKQKEKKKGKDKKEKEKKKKKKSVQGPPDALPLATVGPVVPSLKMKQNPAMAMAVPASRPVAIQGKRQQEGHAQRVVKKKMVRKTVETPSPYEATAGKPISQKDKPISPKRKATSPKGRPVSPRGRPTSPKRRATSPSGRPTSPKRRPTSPTGRPASPTRRPTSPTGRTTSPKPKGTSPGKTVTPTKEVSSAKPTKPTEATDGVSSPPRSTKPGGAATKLSSATTKPSGAATKPSGPTTKPSRGATKPSGAATKPSGAKPSGPAKPKEAAGVAKATGATKQSGPSTRVVKPSGATRPTDETDGPTSAAKPAGAGKESSAVKPKRTGGRPTSPKAKEPQPPQQSSGRPTSPVRSKPVELGSKPSAPGGRVGARPTSPQPKQGTTPTKAVAKPTETAMSKQSAQTKSPPKQAVSSRPPGASKSPSGATGAAKPKSPPKQSSDGGKQPSQRAPASGKPSTSNASHPRPKQGAVKKTAPAGGGGAPVKPSEATKPSKGATKQPPSASGVKRMRPTSPQATASTKPTSKKQSQK